jgi:hypothetical protein
VEQERKRSKLRFIGLLIVYNVGEEKKTNEALLGQEHDYIRTGGASYYYIKDYSLQPLAPLHFY